MFKKIFLVSICALTAIAFAAKKKEPASPLEIWVNSSADAKYYQNMVEVYKKVDPTFNANVRHYGFAELPDKLGMAMKTGINAPDIVQTDEMFFSAFLGDQVPYLDLTEKAKKSGIYNNILPQRLSIFTYQNKLYGIPQSLSNVVLYYRADLFKELKISPSDIDTWEKFVATGKRIRGEQRALLALDWSYWEILARQRGAELFDADGKTRFNEPLVKETLEFITMLQREKIGEKPDRGSIFEPTFFSGDVKNNEVLTIIGAEWYGLDMLHSFSPENAQGKWRAMPLPVWTDEKSNKRRTSTFSGQGLLIYRGTKQPDRAWKFIEYTMKDIDANAERFAQRNCLTAYMPAWSDSRFSKPDSLFGGQNFGNLMIELANESPTPIQAPGRALVLNLFREKYWGQIMGQGMTVSTMIEELSKEAAAGPGHP